MHWSCGLFSYASSVLAVVSATHRRVRGQLQQSPELVEVQNVQGGLDQSLPFSTILPLIHMPFEV